MKIDKELNVLIIVLLVVVIVFLTVQIITMNQSTVLAPNSMNPIPPSGTQTQPGTNPVPVGTDTTADWLTYNDSKNGFSFKYPAAFGANVWRPAQWPPLVTFAANGQDAVAVGLLHHQTGQ